MLALAFPRAQRIAFSTLAASVLALLLSSSVHAISSRTLIAPTGATAGDQFGNSVAGAGDVNGDGYADLIVGAFRNDAGVMPGDAGRAYVYYGGPAADAIADLTLTGATPLDNFGVSVGTAGDVNGDGYADLIVGAYHSDAGGVDAGRAYVYYGGPSVDATADLILTGAAAGDNFGYSVGTAGDVNGDGYADLIVGAYLADMGMGADAGRAYIYYGGPAANATADLILTGASAGDGLGISAGSAGDVNGDGYSDLILGAYHNDAGGADAGRAYVYYGGPAADATADLTLTGAAVSDNFGISVGTAGDVNGDGYADLIVGAFGNDTGGAGAGRAYLYYGGPAADATADLTFTGAAAGDNFGYSVGTAGDVNGDGYADLIVGANLNDAGGTDAGRAYVYFGGPAANATADLTLTGAAAGDRFGVSVGKAGDVNGDDHADLIVGADLNDVEGADAGRAYVTGVYPYQVLSPNGGEQWVAGEAATVRWRGHDVADLAISFDAGASWSTLLASVGGREQNELEVIAPTIATSGARIRLSYTGQPVTRGTSDASDVVFSIVQRRRPPAAACRLQFAPTDASSFDDFGYSVGTAGDVNGDGYSDVIVGALGPAEGRAYVYYGGPSADATADLILTGAAFGDAFGYSVGTAGDVNGDGYADLIVGAPHNDAGGAGAGRVYVYYGGPATDAAADLVFTGAAAGDVFGYSVGTAGDVNGDGFADLIVGAHENDAAGTAAGQAYVYYGGPSADATADLTFTGATAGDHFGVSVGTAADVNGDGFADLIVSASANDAGGADAGRAYVYYGGPAADSTADLTLTGAAVSDNFGISVGTAGDVNGDGHADLIVGADHNDAGGADAGRAYLYYGGPVADATADLTLTGAAAGDNFGHSVGTAGDVNGDGNADLIVGANDAGWAGAGRAYVYYGGPATDATADLTLTGAAALDKFGHSVGTAGDVNGDGYADLIVGAYDPGDGLAEPAYVYECNRYFVLAPNGGQTWNVGATQSISWLGAEPADVWLSVDGGASHQLLETGVGGAGSNTIPVRVPHLPTRFARLKLTPSDNTIGGSARSDSLFTIQSSVSLLSLVARAHPEGGAEVTWSSDPGVGPEGLAGYRLYRLQHGENGSGTRLGPELIVGTQYVDAEGPPGSVYRLIAVNGLQEELELGRVTVATRLAGLHVWPSPLGARGVLRMEFPVPLAAPGFPATDLEVAVFDLGGRRVATLARGPISTTDGVASLRWEESGRAGAGVYFVRVSAPSAGYKAESRIVVVP